MKMWRKIILKRPTCSVIVLLLDGLLECHHGWREVCLSLVAVRDRDGVQIEDLVEAGALDHAIEFLDRPLTGLDINQRTEISIINHLSQLYIDVTALPRIIILITFAADRVQSTFFYVRFVLRRRRCVTAAVAQVLGVLLLHLVCDVAQ